MTTDFLDKLLPINEVQVDDVAQAFISDLNFDSDSIDATVVAGTSTRGGKLTIAVKADAASKLSAWKDPVRSVTVEDVDLTGDNPASSFDDVALEADDRVGVVAQADATENGIYVYQTDGSLERADDFDSAADVKLGSAFRVLEGTLYAGHVFYLASPTDGDVVLGTTELVFEEKLFASELIATRVRPPDVTESLGDASPLALSGARCHADDVGDRPWANVTHHGGIAATSTSGECAMINFMYGDDRAGNPENEWIASEIGHFGTPGARTPTYLRLHTSTNPETGEHVGMLIDGKASLALKSGLGDIAIEPGASKAYGLILSGPGGGVRERNVGNNGAANGAVTVDVLPATILDTAVVPYTTNTGTRTFALCYLEIIARDLAASTWERYRARFVWVGGRTVAQGGAIAAIVADLHDVASGQDGTPGVEVGLVGSGLRVTIEETGGEGGIRVRYTGRGGINMNEVAATLRVQLPI